MTYTIKSIGIYSTYTVWIVTILQKNNTFVLNFDFYSHTFLFKTWSKQRSRFELIAAHLNLAESVGTVGNTDRRHIRKVIPSISWQEVLGPLMVTMNMGDFTLNLYCTIIP